MRSKSVRNIRFRCKKGKDFLKMKNHHLFIPDFFGRIDKNSISPFFLLLSFSLQSFLSEDYCSKPTIFSGSSIYPPPRREKIDQCRDWKVDSDVAKTFVKLVLPSFWKAESFLPDAGIRTGTAWLAWHDTTYETTNWSESSLNLSFHLAGAWNIVRIIQADLSMKWCLVADSRGLLCRLN